LKEGDVLEGLWKGVRDSLRRVKIIALEDCDVEDVNRLLQRLARIGTIQLLDASLVAGEDHVRFACFEALRAFDHRENVASTVSMEILLRAACTRQIDEAIDRLGIRPGCRELVLVAFEVNEKGIEEAVSLVGGKLSKKPLELDCEKRKRIAEAFGLEEPPERSIIEKIALLNAD